MFGLGKATKELNKYLLIALDLLLAIYTRDIPDPVRAEEARKAIEELRRDV